MRQNLKIKFCGLQSEEDIQKCSKADYLGFIVEVPSSKRNLTLEQAEKLINQSNCEFISVAVTRNLNKIESISETIHPDFIQLHTKIQDCDSMLEHLEMLDQRFIVTIGSSDNEMINTNVLTHEIGLKSEYILLDSIVDKTIAGGSGKTQNLVKTAKIINENKNLRFMVAGGIRSENVLNVVQTTKPFGVDVSSGIETINNRKDIKLIKNFLTTLEKYTNEG